MKSRRNEGREFGVARSYKDMDFVDRGKTRGRVYTFTEHHVPLKDVSDTFDHTDGEDFRLENLPNSHQFSEKKNGDGERKEEHERR